MPMQVRMGTVMPTVYLTITLTGVLISGYSMSPSASAGSGLPMEFLSLTFTKAEYGPSAGVQPHTAPLPHQNPPFWNIRPPARQAPAGHRLKTKP